MATARCLHPRYYPAQGKYFPCGKCPSCLSRNRDELAQRLYVEACTSRSAYFVTLTYDDENLPFAEYDLNCFDKDEVRKFIRSMRDFLRPKSINIRFFVTCEYGDLSNRSHYHVLLYFSDFLSLQQVYTLCADHWNFGNVYVSSVGKGCAKYCAKYCLKDDGTELLPKGDPNKPFRLFSLKPGIGCTPEALKYWKDNFFLSLDQENKYDGSTYFLPGNFYESRANFCKKVPRAARGRMSVAVQESITSVGWRKYYGYVDELKKSLCDRSLNFYDPLRDQFIPVFDKDFEIKEKARKLRRLKKNCL